jgi:putative transposase
MVVEHGVNVRAACRAARISVSGRYYRPKARSDGEVITVLNAIVERHPRWGFWKCYYRLRLDGHRWNHKRVHRVYCELRLNVPRRAKRRVPPRIRESLSVPTRANQVWSMDFMSDCLYGGRVFRTLNIVDDYNREVVAIEVDTSLPSLRVVRVLEQLSLWRGLPQKLRVDNGPEFTGSTLTAWAERRGVTIQYIQPGKPNQNAYIERFNRSYREEVLNAYLFNTLDEVREITHWWLVDYNEHRPHDALNRLPPVDYARQDEKRKSSPLARSS